MFVITLSRKKLVDSFNFNYFLINEVNMNILIIVYSDIQRDVRVLKQLNYLNNHNVTLMSFNNYSAPNVEHIEIKNTFPLFIKMIGVFLLKLKLYNLYYWILPTNVDCYQKIKKRYDFDLIIANDIYTLPLAWRIKKQSILIFDAHEYYPREHDNNKQWMFFFHDYMNYLCRNYATKADYMFTIGQSIRNEYHKNFKLNPIILMNLPEYTDLSIKSSDNNSFKMVHHGVALPGRQIELMIELLKQLGNQYFLDLFLVNHNHQYTQFLKDLIKDEPNIKIFDPLKINEIIPTLNNYDIGFYFLKSNSFNDINCLPNKLFDFIQARLAVIIGPSPEMRRIVEEYDCGIATKSFNVDEIVEEIKTITKEDIIRYKKNADIAAKELNSDMSREIFMKIINEIEIKTVRNDKS